MLSRSIYCWSPFYLPLQWFLVVFLSWPWTNLKVKLHGNMPSTYYMRTNMATIIFWYHLYFVLNILPTSVFFLCCPTGPRTHYMDKLGLLWSNPYLTDWNAKGTASISTIPTYPQQESIYCQQLRFNSIDAIIARDNVSLLFILLTKFNMNSVTCQEMIGRFASLDNW